MSDRISPAEAESILLKHLRVLQAEDCALSTALGRILREPLLSDRPSPPYDRVMMDGVSLQAEKMPADGWFRLITETPAGAPRYEGVFEVGDAVGISTGSVMPRHADCVVPVENVVFQGDRFQITRQPNPGEFIHPEGSDLAQGDQVLSAGKILNARDLSVAAGYGAHTLSVGRKPVVGILTSGTELVEVDAQPLPHQIRRSNDVAVAGMLQEAGFESLPAVHLPDDPQQIQIALEALLARCDVLFVCGGISKGKHDYLPDALAAAGYEKVFHRVTQKPGSPFGFWTGEGCQVFGLPGNPLSTFVCTARYGIPFLRAMSGYPTPFECARYSISTELMPHPTLMLYKPFLLNQEGRAQPIAFQNSGDLIRPLGSSGLLMVPPGDHILPAGSILDWIPW